ncbi:hypothetical protein CXG81DRAFT_17703 [Caulochytrium protostelioides]|uniref:NAD-dependent epimerase/dehydratase domain-containing protein n=1 Tax=Caulochytrium protostelioides TaxID=1555241 RepID=A0A4P9XBX8_9FUNG|nr:hypothetical protein CXG81DRAFT_17703 [Caulochytrium protostelioides]|eukprot:RKP02650.1 hypothetical protein CXG81DRAFT_17703 [Caulochytrium protostelioides]
MKDTIVIGATGGVGSSIVKFLTTLAETGNITTIGRRHPSTTHEKISSIVEADTAQWPLRLPPVTAATPTTFFSALGTTRAAAGGLEQQIKIDRDLNLEMAKAAKAAGVTTYVLISSNSASASSWSSYLRFKGELEDGVKELNFDKTVIVQPGLILVEREEKRLAEAATQMMARGLSRLFGERAIGCVAQSHDKIARAAVREALGHPERQGVVVLSQADIMKLGFDASPVLVPEAAAASTEAAAS